MPKKTADRLAARWSRLFKGSDAFPWERFEAQRLLYEVSKSAAACQMVAELLEIQCDPGESAADYVSQMLRQPTLDHARRLHERDIAEIYKGFADQQATPSGEVPNG
ncbi:hypothetical protein TP46_12390 [Xanthomonas citri pv. aurantifolii]|nr:hypothetical protein TP49_11895 [Xanthomonas citri pv. aurantifolii]TBX03224.1 hypothetical protein TP46_12390 [Xanthomonas citri pv. aurantifolii]